MGHPGVETASGGEAVAIDYRAMFEATPNPYLLLAADAPRFSIVGVNEAYLSATGTTREQLVGHGMFDAFPDNPDDPEANGVSDLRASLDRVLRDRAADAMGVQKYDIPIREKPGQFEVRYWSPVNTPVRDGRGRVSHIIHRVEDVTAYVLARVAAAGDMQAPIDRIEAEVLRGGTELKAANRQIKIEAERQRLRERERLRFAMDAARLGEVVFDADGVVSHSPGFARLFGLPANRRVTIDEIEAHYHPEDRDAVRDHFAAVRRGDVSYFEFEHRVVTGDGEVRWLEARGQPSGVSTFGEVQFTAVYMDMTERKSAELRQRLLLDELNHRVKNTLATVLAISGQTRRFAESPEDFDDLFIARIRALARAHDLLTSTEWDGASLRDLLTLTLEPYSDDEAAGTGRVAIDGPSVKLGPNAAVTLNMAFHELGTNAAKFGALSVPAGRLAVNWTVTHGSDAILDIVWLERGGPPVLPPRRRGFGSRLIEEGMTREFDAVVELNFDPQGLMCRIRIPMSHRVTLA
jgi:PAS domain S-box-containing protein